MSLDHIKIDESDIDEYEEVQAALARYEESSAKLLTLFDRREEMVRLLKIAQPSKIAAVRECIARLDKQIAFTETMIEENLTLIEKSRALARHYKQLEAFLKIAEPQFLAYIAEHKPEKLELAKAMLEDDGKSH